MNTEKNDLQAIIHVLRHREKYPHATVVSALHDAAALLEVHLLEGAPWPEGSEPKKPLIPPTSTLQDWVHNLPRMQQATLLSALRGPDNVPKAHPSKGLVRYLRRCVMITAFDGVRILDMHAPGGGDYTGPVTEGMCPIKDFMWCIDALPFHFTTHFIFAAEILAYQHDVFEVRKFWIEFYLKVCKKLHMHPETKEELNARLSDDYEIWKANK